MLIQVILEADVIRMQWLRQSNVLMCLFVQYYGFTQFALLLNEIDDNLRVKIAPTDSRLRPDMRRMEEGDFGGYFLFYM